MVEIPYAYCKGHLSVEVYLTQASDVFLVDSINYKKYQSGVNFKFHGGHYTQTPVRISVYGMGRWYLIVRGKGQYQYRFF